MKNKRPFPTLPEKSWGQAGLECFANLAKCFPVLGSSIGSWLANVSEEINNKRHAEFIDHLEKYCKGLPQEILESEEFVYAVRKLFIRFTNEPSAKKRIFILHLHRSLCHKVKNNGDSSPFDIYFIFDGLFDQLSLPALDCLVAFKRRFISKAARYEIVSYFNELTSIHGKRAFLELSNNGLLAEDGLVEMPPVFSFATPQRENRETPLGQKVYKLEPLGEIFIEWLHGLSPDEKDGQEE